MNYVELHIGDYEKDTAHLSACEDGIYGRLIRRYYNTEGPLPADMKAVERLARARTREEKKAVRSIIEEFFFLGDGGFHHTRCDREIERYTAKRDKARRSAEIRWSRRVGGDSSGEEGADAAPNTPPTAGCDGNANALRRQYEGNAPRARVPYASHQSPVTSTAPDTSTRADTSSRADDLARALVEMGWRDCSGGSPDLIAAAAAGVSVAGIRDAAAGKSDKGVAYIARRAIGRLQDAQGAGAPSSNGAAVPSVDPRAAAERQWRWDIEAEILDVEQRCDRMGLITEDVRDAEVRKLKAQLAAGWQEGKAVHA